MRGIPIDDELAVYLYAWKKHQRVSRARSGVISRNYLDKEKRFLSCSPGKEPDGAKAVHLVCKRADGRYYPYATLSARLRSCGLNAHSFRHTHATALIEGGASAKSVADRLGHASTNLTENLYAHATDKMRQDALRVFEQVLGENHADK